MFKKYFLLLHLEIKKTGNKYLTEKKKKKYCPYDEKNVKSNYENTAP